MVETGARHIMASDAVESDQLFHGLLPGWLKHRQVGTLVDGWLRRLAIETADGCIVLELA